MADLTVGTARNAADAFLASAPRYPADRLAGRGIVICGGGSRYFTCAWVCIKVLRSLGCQLPIELWQLNEYEADEKMRQLVEPLGVRCVDASAMRRSHPVRILNGWELKPYSMIHCQFEEMLFLDADNVPVVDPGFLFDTPQYLRTGAVFWPDFGRLAPDREIWRICEVEYRNEPEFETGQILINKKICWHALQLTMHLNEHSDFYYSYVHGDKETFHMAWRMLDQPYSMPSRGIDALAGVMCQHDFDGRRIFQHRNLAKWQLHDRNPSIGGFLLEERCLAALEDLRQQWDGKVGHADILDPLERDAAQGIQRQRRFHYIRIGHDNRELELMPGGKIGAGRSECEEIWFTRRLGNITYLVIVGRGEETCRLAKDEDGIWKGRWCIHERMRVELHPVLIEIAEHPMRDIVGQLCSRRWVYRRIGYDQRVIGFSLDGRISEGAAACEQAWTLDGGTTPVLSILGRDGTTCILARANGQHWVGKWLIHESMEVELTPDGY